MMAVLTHIIRCIKIDNKVHYSETSKHDDQESHDIYDSTHMCMHDYTAYVSPSEIRRRYLKTPTSVVNYSQLTIPNTTYNLINYAMSQPNDKILDYLVITKRLGDGCFGTVDKAYNSKLEKDVAVKVMDKKRVLALPDGPQRVENELMIMQRLLKHPNIIEFYRWFEYADNIYLEMEVFAHKDLGRWFNLSHPKEIHLKPIIKKVIEGVMFLHEHGIYHQDIKPSNILYDPIASEIRIIDFGLATMSNEPVNTRFEIPMATSTSYEVALNKPYTPMQADIWQIGSLIYECMSGGVIPFRPWTKINYDESKWKKAYRTMISLPNDIIDSLHPYFFPEETPIEINKSKMEVARLDLINLRYYTNVMWSDDLKSLIRGIFQPVDSRLSLHDIYNHRWFTVLD